jgi:AbrB family looped-hinge helix DNA binding protein
MAKVTSKLQVTVPKVVADRLGIAPGDDIEWRLEGASARVTRSNRPSQLSAGERLAIFDESTARQGERNRAWMPPRRAKSDAGRGWTREELYTRGRAR